MKSISLVLFILLLLVSCKSTMDVQTGNEDILFEIGNDKVTVNEFVYVYSKNNRAMDSVLNEADIREYFDLFINFKLKVKEAKHLGLDTTKAFIQELEGYRKELAKPYLTKSKVTNELIDESYDRMKYEINASHILIRLPENTLPEDTIDVYNKVLEIRNRLINGEDFDTMAKEVSEDPSAKRNGGHLGYFSALQMVYPFETAAYATTPGEISMPVRTRFGYHLIKVLDKRNSRGKVKVSHIMIRSNEAMPGEEKANNKQKIDEIYKQLMDGNDWVSLCSQFSQDLSTNKKGGELPWLGTGSVDPTFESQAFTLEKAGDISRPFLTPYGWHIIKLEDKMGIDKFEDIKPQLEERIEQDSRSALSKNLLIDRLKQENQYNPNDDIILKILNQADSSLIIGNWAKPADLNQVNPAIFNIGEQAIKLDSFYNFVQGKQRPQPGIAPQQIMKNYFQEFVENTLTAYEEAHLSERYLDYRMILKEYYEGILLFELMDKKVWSKAVEDSIGLEKFYNQNLQRYQWETRMDGIVFNAMDISTIEKLKTLKTGEFFKNFMVKLKPEAIQPGQGWAQLDELIEKYKQGKGALVLTESKQGNDSLVSVIKQYMVENGVKSEDLLDTICNQSVISVSLLTNNAKYLEDLFNKDQPLTLQVEEGIYEQADLPILDKIEWGRVGEFEIKQDNRVYWVLSNKIIPPTTKKLDQIRGIVISDYQNRLDALWIMELKSKYPVKIHESAFKKSIKILEDKT